MANIATNIVQVHFLNTPTPEYKIAAFKEFFEEFEFYTEMERVELDLQTYDYVDFEFGSKWSEPTEFLQNLCDKYNMKIVGVCHEWGCSYVSSFELEPNIQSKEDKEEEKMQHSQDNEELSEDEQLTL